jgi:hypothetical protein
MPQGKVRKMQRQGLAPTGPEDGGLPEASVVTGSTNKGTGTVAEQKWIH